jgi:sensor histidine kinase YesM
MVPILIAIIVLIGSWWVVYDRTASLQTAQAELVLAENRDLRFRAVTNELSSLLILGDLIVASNQTFLLLAYEEQTRSIDSELNYFSEALSTCCDPEAANAARLHLSRMEEAANEASVARTAKVSGNWLDVFDQNSSGILEAFNRLEEVLALNRNALSNTLGKQQETYLLAFVTTVLGSLISLSSLAWWISTRVTRPISRLSTNATEAIKGVKFLGLEKGPSELTELSDTLTTLTGGLQNALDQERAQVI